MRLQILLITAFFLAGCSMQKVESQSFTEVQPPLKSAGKSAVLVELFTSEG